MAELQRIVDSLGTRLQRAVAIDDPRMRLQVYSPHHGEVDAARLDSILHREAPRDATAWVLTQGVAAADGPVRVPANEQLGLLARVCVPIRCQGLLLGYLWLIDAQSSLSAADLAIAAAAAEAAGVVLYREQLLHELHRGRARELLRDLLADDVQIRRHAARTLLDTGALAPTSRAASLVVQPLHPTGRQPDETVRVAIDLALDDGRRALATPHHLHLTRPDHGVFLVDAEDPGVRAGGLPGFGARLRDRLLRALAPDPAWRVGVGIGAATDELAEAAGSYRQARLAARVAGIVPLHGPVASWDRLGVYRTLAQLPPEELTTEALHPGLVALLQTEGCATLVQTLECYLDRAGHVKATAEALVVHRTSLYYRLSRIEALTGTDLDDGDDRLALHLGLKMARLVGIHPSQTAG